MKLICRQCHEDAEGGHPKDITTLMPKDRRNYRHVVGKTALCPEDGITASGGSGSVPCLPIEKKTRR